MTDTEFLDFHEYLKSGIRYLESAMSLIENNDSKKILKIRTLIANKILIHKKFILTQWMESKSEKINERISEEKEKEVTDNFKKYGHYDF